MAASLSDGGSGPGAGSPAASSASSRDLRDCGTEGESGGSAGSVAEAPLAANGVARRGLAHFLAKPRQWRIQLIQRPWLLPMAAMQLAAIVIQRAWRPCWLRAAAVTVSRGLWCPLPPSLSSPGNFSIGVAGSGQGGGTITCSGSGGIGECQAGDAGAASVLAPPQLDATDGRVRTAMRCRYLALVRRQYERAHKDRSKDVSHGQVYATFEHFCAALIQSMWRHSRRYNLAHIRRVLGYKHLMFYHIAAYELQSAWRDHRHFQINLRRTRDNAEATKQQHALKVRTAAAARIQRAFRSLSDRRVYLALKGMIANFRGTGDPTLLLRTILPREALIADPAMQIHLRFRLGGSKFPPSIYYKVYTHGAVADIGAFAPRSYAAERLGRSSGNGDDFYVRVENNGWRPLAVRWHLNGRGPDEVQKETSKKEIRHFHYSRSQRRRDAAHHRRKKAVEWMRKLCVQRAQSTATEKGPPASDDVDESSMPPQIKELLVDNSDRVQGSVAEPAVGLPSGRSGAARLAAGAFSSGHQPRASFSAAARAELRGGAQDDRSLTATAALPRAPLGPPPSRPTRHRPSSGVDRASPVCASDSGLGADSVAAVWNRSGKARAVGFADDAPTLSNSDSAIAAQHVPSEHDLASPHLPSRLRTEDTLAPCHTLGSALEQNPFDDIMEGKEHSRERRAQEESLSQVDGDALIAGSMWHFNPETTSGLSLPATGLDIPVASASQQTQVRLSVDPVGVAPSQVHYAGSAVDEGRDASLRREEWQSGASSRVEDLPDDLLLEWSRRLDFDSYMENWRNIATSDGSEGALPIGLVR